MYYKKTKNKTKETSEILQKQERKNTMYKKFLSAKHVYRSAKNLLQKFRKKKIQKKIKRAKERSVY